MNIQSNYLIEFLESKTENKLKLLIHEFFHFISSKYFCQKYQWKHSPGILWKILSKTGEITI